jgi:capsular polysaccharide biosynthesis protein
VGTENSAAAGTNVRALTRYWWLVVAGLVLGAAAAVVVYKQEAKPRYTATTNLFVNSSSAPYLRTQQGAQPNARTKTGNSATKATPDTNTLVNAANTYPLLIQSDRISQVRQRHYGTIPGTVTANALNATTNTYGVYRPSPLPVIQVKATSTTPEHAEQLVDGTVAAFQLWMRQQQKQHQIPPSERISVQQLSTPTVATVNARSKGLPLFIGVLVLLAFCGLAVIADNRRSDGTADVAEPSRHGDAGVPAQHSLEG